jgi:protein-L-isoaspartate(D-aspartate) O-methyltransferase
MNRSGKYGSNAGLVAGIAEAAADFFDGSTRSPRVLMALEATDRALFLPPRARAWAYTDAPVGIGEGQTCSQPSLVAFMLDALDIEPGHRVLEIGAGCGYAAAAAARLCAPQGIVVAVERLDALAFLCRANCALFGDRVEVVEGDGSDGLPGQEPFDRILVSAGVRPRSFREELLVARLSEGGILVYPETYGKLHRVERRGRELIKKAWGNVSFVPLIGRNS